jgi:hypothetical protein
VRIALAFIVVFLLGCAPSTPPTVDFFEKLDVKRQEVGADLVPVSAPTRAGTITNLGTRQQVLWEYAHWLEQVKAPDPELTMLVKKLADNAADQAIGTHGVRIALANGWDDKVYAVEQLLRLAELDTAHLASYEIQLRLKLGVHIPMLPDA